MGLALVGPLFVVVAYVVCILIATTGDTYIGGISFPYFSDIGRDKPAYYVFASFISVAAICLMFLMPLQYYYVIQWYQIEASSSRKIPLIIAVVCAFVGAIGAILLSCFSTTKYPDIHQYSAYAFFVLLLLHAILSLWVYKGLANVFEEHKKLMVPRYVVTAVLLVAVIIYLPVGLAIVCEWTRLGMQDCLQIRDAAYCEESVNPSQTNETLLWDYSACATTNVMRSSTQFLSVISLMAFIILYALDPGCKSKIIS